jgi:hypothetical protein
MKVALPKTQKVGNGRGRGRGRVGVRASVAESVDDCGLDLDHVPVLILAPHYAIIRVRVLVRVSVRGFGHNHALA